MLGFYGQRCGTAVALSFSGASFAHGVCHHADVDLSYFDGTGQPPTVVGGWHDAGDYGRYTVNGGLTLGFMLRAWEDFSAVLGPVALAIPESGGATPDFLAETRRQVEWLLGMEYGDGSGRFSNAVKSPDFPALNVMPEDDTSPIALASASTMGTAIAAGALAEAARVYQPYDAAFAQRCLAGRRARLRLGHGDPRPGHAQRRLGRRVRLQRHPRRRHRGDAGRHGPDLGRGGDLGHHRRQRRAGRLRVPGAGPVVRLRPGAGLE